MELLPNKPAPKPNYWLPALEIVALNLSMNRTARLYGGDFAKISLGSMWRNVRGKWEWDRDRFTVNQFRHPYMGAAFYTSARSSGVGFWGSAGYAFMGSLMWEALMETDRPSINDQIVTPLGGVILGEAKHRFSRALLWRSASWWRRGLAALVNPVAAFNRYVLGRKSHGARPPPHFASVGAGYNAVGEQQVAAGSSRSRLFNQLHLALALSYGLPGDAQFVPRRPMDHMDLVAELDISEGEAVGTLFVRGLLAGKRYRHGRVRGLWGVYTSYDFFNPDRYRVGALSVGVGSSLQVRLGSKGFLQGTTVYSAVPFGAAGTIDDPERNYHWGPGLSQLHEVRIGRADTGMLKLTTRGYAIAGSVFDEGSEVISHTTMTGLLRVWKRHAIGAEVVGSIRRARFDDANANLTDTGGQLRVFYAFTSDTKFGSAAR